jgi:hypothetical protein
MAGHGGVREAQCFCATRDLGGACGRFDGGRDRHVKRGSRLIGHATNPRWGLNSQSRVGCIGWLVAVCWRGYGQRAFTTALKSAVPTAWCTPGELGMSRAGQTSLDRPPASTQPWKTTR